MKAAVSLAGCGYMTRLVNLGYVLLHCRERHRVRSVLVDPPGVDLVVKDEALALCFA